MEVWLVVFLAGALTYLTRLSFIGAHGRVYPPSWFTRALAYVPVAVLSAIILPELLAPGGTLARSPASPQLIAGACAAFAAWRTKSVWLTICVGMVVLFASKAVLGLG